MAVDISRARAALGKREEAGVEGPAEAETTAADTSPDMKALGLLFSFLALFLSCTPLFSASEVPDSAGAKGTTSANVPGVKQ